MMNIGMSRGAARITLAALLVGVVAACSSSRTSVIGQAALAKSSAPAAPVPTVSGSAKPLTPGPVPAELAIAFAGPSDRIVTPVKTRSSLILSVPDAGNTPVVAAAAAVRAARAAVGDLVPDPRQYAQSVKLALYTQAVAGDSSAPAGARTIPELVWVILSKGVDGPAPLGAQPPPGQPKPSYLPYKADVITLVDAATGSVGITAYFG
jgi:hypothetical protein